MDFQEQQQQQKKNFHKKIDWKPLSRDLPAFTDSRGDVDVLYSLQPKGETQNFYHFFFSEDF